MIGLYSNQTRNFRQRSFNQQDFKGSRADSIRVARAAQPIRETAYAAPIPHRDRVGDSCDSLILDRTSETSLLHQRNDLMSYKVSIWALFAALGSLLTASGVYGQGPVQNFVSPVQLFSIGGSVVVGPQTGWRSGSVLVSSA